MLRRRKRTTQQLRWTTFKCTEHFIHSCYDCHFLRLKQTHTHMRLLTIQTKLKLLSIETVLWWIFNSKYTANAFASFLPQNAIEPSWTMRLQTGFFFSYKKVFAAYSNILEIFKSDGVFFFFLSFLFTGYYLNTFRLLILFMYSILAGSR